MNQNLTSYHSDTKSEKYSYKNFTYELFKPKEKTLNNILEYANTHRTAKIEKGFYIEYYLN